jgi:hypothetical protein
MSFRGIIILGAVILLVFGALLAGFAVYTHMEYGRAWGRFLDGQNTQADLKLLIKDRERLCRFLTNELESADDNRVLYIGGNIEDIQRSEPAFPALEEISKSSYARFLLVKAAYAASTTEAKKYLALATRYYPFFNMKKQLVELLDRCVSSQNRFAVLDEIVEHFPSENAIAQLLFLLDSRTHDYADPLEILFGTRNKKGAKDPYKLSTYSADCPEIEMQLSAIKADAKTWEKFADKFETVLCGDKREPARMLAAWLIFNKLNPETAKAIFLKSLMYKIEDTKAVQTEMPENLLNFVTLVLDNMGALSSAAAIVLFEKYQESTYRDKILWLSLTGGKRELLKNLKTMEFYRRYKIGGNFSDLAEGLARVLNEPENVLYFDNGAAYTGQILSEDNNTLVFLVWGENESEIAVSKNSFYRYLENEPASANTAFKNSELKIESLIDGQSPGEESSINYPLRWLHYHQNIDGEWDTAGFTKNCKRGTCAGEGKYDFNIGATGLALSAFLQYGHTHQNGEFKKTVRKALRYLKGEQGKDGFFGDRDLSLALLQHYIGASVISKAYLITGDLKMKQMAEAATKNVIAEQNPDGGWSVSKGEQSSAVGTIWAVEALNYARSSGFEIPDNAWTFARDWFDKATDNAGNVLETLNPADNVTVLSSPIGRRGMSYLCRRYCGEPSTTPEMRALADRIFSENPPENNAYSFQDAYFNVHAMYLSEDSRFRKWHIQIKKSLAHSQIKGGCPYGSWDVPENPGPLSGRVEATALNTLSLNPPSARFILSDSLYDFIPAATNFDMLNAALCNENWSWRCRAVFALGQTRGFLPGADYVLEKALSDKDEFVRANAARSLGNLNARESVPAIKNILNDSSAFVRAMAKEALEKLAASEK